MARPKQSDPQFKLRIPSALKDKLEQAASVNNRAISAEILARLSESFDWPAVRNGLNHERDYLEGELKKTQAELASVRAALAEQKTITQQLQALIGESAEDAQHRQEAEDAIEKRFAELKEQSDLLESLKEELAHLSHARGDTSAQTEALLKQQSELIEQLRINQALSEQTISVFRDAFLDAASGDESAFERLIEATRKKRS
ncbi:Arc family DNA-binding protein [Mesorhizobium sp.]|uniref:Arc family DNA-binding protein n=1 Tax=Mesorhizobium sp. TaxID=1871066 RepID=UPI000FE8FD1B|nr:Arc family DNA-binding protein [Mesorhizobium sp.]RWG02545.1 MAG: Arc family DNA-binding protein [Mesorhizobium sp.]RWH00824.1 MAG: Arc family DNA-binding protein [Mesorhizobium sp.]TIN34847.1 MAG: Arc family DNA-binding protein [Mesorhizobium sp.]TIR88860.1 MAG: Arc family DNA-binding protein [Mesorhizobium sp.]TIS02469.1 MAG: Arc family DNA-binding protein [Mesorhizobium sp.]